MKSHYVKAHTIHRKGKVIYIKAHEVKGHEVKAHTIKSYVRHDKRFKVPGHSGERFKALSDEVAAEYRKKGYSAKRAREVGDAVAGKVYWRKYGKKGGEKILREER